MTPTPPMIGDALPLHPERAGTRRMTIEDLVSMPRVGAPAVSRDGATLIVPVATADIAANASLSRLWRIDSSASAQPPRALTPSTTSSGEPAISPNGIKLAYTSNDANGHAQLHIMTLASGNDLCVTDLPLGVFGPKWLPDGSGLVFGAILLKGHASPQATAKELGRRRHDPALAYVTEDRFYRFWNQWLTTGEIHHLFRLNPESGDLQDLTPFSTAWFDWFAPGEQYDLAPDGSELAYSAIAFDVDRDLLRSTVFRLPLAGGTAIALPCDTLMDQVRPRYSPDGRFLVYGARSDPFFSADPIQLWRFDRATSECASWLGNWRSSPTTWDFAPDGTLLLTAEDEARVSLFRWDGSGAPSLLVQGGTLRHVTTASDNIYFSLSTLSAPAEVYTLRGDGTSLTPLSDFTSEVHATLMLGSVYERRFTGSYNELVQMFIILPPGYDHTVAYPLVHVIHGGPQGVVTDGFALRWNGQLLAAAGYVVVFVNYQGSTSWGDEFARRIQGAWSDRPFEDIMRATDALVAAGLADPDRLAAMGNSFGGYLVAWIAGHSDRFRCLVSHAGVFDTLAWYASDITQGHAAALGGVPWGDMAAIDRNNPARFSAGFTTPMLVIHGGRDERVPSTQAFECYGILKAKGVPARLLYFPEEGHRILRPRSTEVLYREILTWLARFLHSEK